MASPNPIIYIGLDTFTCSSTCIYLLVLFILKLFRLSNIKLYIFFQYILLITKKLIYRFITRKLSKDFLKILIFDISKRR